jgi:hypothetical protein
MLIDEWRRAHKLWSVRLSAAGAALLTAAEVAQQCWASLPADVQAAVPYGQNIGLLLVILTPIARVIRQGEKGNG